MSRERLLVLRRGDLASGTRQAACIGANGTRDAAPQRWIMGYVDESVLALVLKCHRRVVAGDGLCFSMSDEKFLFGCMGQPNLHVAANGSRPSPWSLPFEEVSSGLTGGEVLLWSSALKRSAGAASVLLWSASGGPVSGPSRACEGVTVAGGGMRLPLRAH